MQCPFCHQEINNEAKFCARCGRKIPRCPSCNTIITSKIKFCKMDGTLLPEDLFLDFPETGVKLPPNLEEKYYCRKCGAVVRKDETLCANCKVSQKNKKKILVILSLSCVLAVLIGLVIAFYFITSDHFKPSIDNNLSIITPDTSSEIVKDGDSDVIKPINSSDEMEEEKKTVSDSFGSESEDSEQSTTVGQEEEASSENRADIDHSDYILPNSDSTYLSMSDLSGFTAEECKIARNEIYARHGRKFTDPELQEYFDACDWYSGSIEPDLFSESLLNDYEIANRDLIVAYEKKQGYRKS